MDVADMREFERVQVVNVNNGAWLETYLIAGGRGSGTVRLDGAATRLRRAGDHVVVITYAEHGEREPGPHFAPKLAFVDAQNRMRR